VSIETKADALSASLEDYLEAIMHIEDEKQAARPKSIARRLHVSPPSVTAAVQSLAARGLVNHQPYGPVTLTDTGRALATDVARRHVGLRRFLVEILRIERAEADRVACDMEHSLPSDVLARLVEFIDFIAKSPHGGVTWTPDEGFQLKSAGDDTAEATQIR